jgi:hypothetical protein
MVSKFSEFSESLRKFGDHGLGATHISLRAIARATVQNQTLQASVADLTYQGKPELRGVWQRLVVEPTGVVTTGVHATLLHVQQFDGLGVSHIA